jgi:hypothetical protein
MGILSAQPATPGEDERLAPLFEPLASLPGLGPAGQKLFAKALANGPGGGASGNCSVLDLLFHLPT